MQDEPATRRPNLTVQSEALVEKVLFEGGCHGADGSDSGGQSGMGAVVSGVQYTASGGRKEVTARKEVVLAAGAVGSPQLLLLSGIGPVRRARQTPILRGISARERLNSLCSCYMPTVFRDRRPSLPVTAFRSWPMCPGCGDGASFPLPCRLFLYLPVCAVRSHTALTENTCCLQVGKNLQDHPDFVMKFRCNQPVTLFPVAKEWSIAQVLAGAEWLLTGGGGVCGSNHFDVVATVSSDSVAAAVKACGYPDLQLTLSPIAMELDGSFRPLQEHAFQIHVGLMQAFSRGEVRADRSACSRKQASLNPSCCAASCVLR
eukprot:SAG22_NODE_437_length_10501_cov_3.019804_12_plen_317_part_00